MTETITATENITTETNKGKRGRKAYTFHDLVSMEPNEVSHAWADYMSRVFGITADPKLFQLTHMSSVRNMFHESEEYKVAEAARQARIDTNKAVQVAASVDSLLAKLSPEQRAALASALSA